MTDENKTSPTDETRPSQSLGASAGSINVESFKAMMGCPVRLRTNILRHGPEGYDLYSVEQIERIKAEATRVVERESEQMRVALIRLRDCDWVVTPHDRMDAVRQIARDALSNK